MDLVTNGFYSRVRALEFVRGVQNGDTKPRNGRIRRVPVHHIARCVFGAQLPPQGPCLVLGPRSVHYTHCYIEYPTIATEGLHRFLSACHWAELRMHQIPDILSSWTFRHVRRPRTVLNHSNSYTECLESIWDTSGCTSGVV